MAYSSAVCVFFLGGTPVWCGWGFCGVVCSFGVVFFLVWGGVYSGVSSLVFYDFGWCILVWHIVG